MVFNFLGGGNNPNPAPAPAQTPAPANPANPAPANPAPSPNPANPANPAPQPVTLNPSLYEMLTSATAENGSSPTAEESAANFIQTALAQGAANTYEIGGAPSINTDKLAEFLPTLGLSNGIDFGAIATSLAGENPAEALKTFTAAVQTNTIMGITPMINELVAQAVQSAREAAVTQTQHNLSAASIVSAFQERYAYGKSGATQGLITNFANQLAQTAPRGTTPGEIADSLHIMLTQFKLM